MVVTQDQIDEMLKARKAALAAKAAKDEAGWRLGSLAQPHSAPGSFGATVTHNPTREAEAARLAAEWEERNAGPIALKKAQSAQADRNRRENWQRHVDQRAAEAKERRAADTLRREKLTSQQRTQEDAKYAALEAAQSQRMVGGRKSKRRKSKRRKSKRRKSKRRKSSRRN